MVQVINDSDVIAEVRDCFERYNAALEGGDAEALNGFFWQSPATVRFGPSETLFGYDEISNFRSRIWKGTSGGRIAQNAVITTFGRDVATTNAVFRAGNGATSRQSQTWVRLAEGWRIVAAHVSAAP